MAEKSLLNKTSVKPKKSKSKRQTTDNTIPYKFDIGDTAIYKGYGYENEPCTIIDRSRKYVQDFYRVKFDNLDEVETIVDILLTPEEFEKCQEENKSSQIDVEMLDKSLQNPLCCHDQVMFYQMACHECKKEPICVYRNKGNYKKLNIW